MDLEELRRRVARLEGRPVDTATLETHEVLRGLVSVRAGGVYGVDAASLALALLAGPSSSGAWCGVVACPDLGLGAAAEWGVDLDRLVVVPDPGAAWWETVAALVDALTVVVACPPARVTQREAARLAARLRTRQSVLAVWGEWPRCEARLSLVSSQWSGIGDGHGRLRSRRAVIEARADVTRRRRREVWLPGTDGTLGVVDEPAPVEALRGVS
ncbi:MAG: hypothetical protein QM621_06895 [Aeromicrobium sp.]|uniref:hypothetical protein n=1 Tax=Aeromicrobium sp. TaxID=1871063 RepID=UPI0039E6645D